MNNMLRYPAVPDAEIAGLCDASGCGVLIPGGGLFLRSAEHALASQIATMFDFALRPVFCATAKERMPRSWEAKKSHRRDVIALYLSE
jgi:hypothetical protein